MLDQKELDLMLSMQDSISRNANIRDNALMYIPSFFVGLDMLRNEFLSFSSDMLTLGVLFMILSFFLTDKVLHQQAKSVATQTVMPKSIDRLGGFITACNLISLLSFIAGMAIMVIK